MRALLRLIPDRLVRAATSYGRVPRMQRLHRLVAVASFAMLLCMTAAAFAENPVPAADIGEKVPGAERLEGRLLAPCCWAQTLDIHGSDIANSLRHEIRARLRAGESADRIEASLVERYGQRIRAVPDSVPLDKLGGLGWLAVAGAAAFVGLVLWRWRRRGSSPDSSSIGKGDFSAGSGAVSSEASDERLELELHRLDES
jgi:cytochrome c-type biogenesis protein CcmH